MLKNTLLKNSDVLAMLSRLSVNQCTLWQERLLNYMKKTKNSKKRLKLSKQITGHSRCARGLGYATARATSDTRQARSLKTSKSTYRKFSKAQIELAHQVANDISEKINTGQSISELRQCISYWADVASKAVIEKKALESKIRVIRIGFEIMKATVNP